MMEKKKSKIGLIIMISIVVILLIIAVVGGIFLYLEKKEEQDWANIYYSYIEIATNEENESYQELEKKEDTEIGFVNLEGLENPVMIIQYTEDDAKCMKVVYIKNGSNQYTVLSYSQSTIEYLYDIENEEYAFYII